MAGRSQPRPRLYRALRSIGRVATASCWLATRFLQLLFATNGRTFGAEHVCGAAPTEIVTPFKRSPELIDLFVSAYNGFPQAWASLDAYQPDDHFLDPTDPAQARQLVDRHLRTVTFRPRIVRR